MPIPGSATNSAPQVPELVRERPPRANARLRRVFRAQAGDARDGSAGSVDAGGNSLYDLSRQGTRGGTLGLNQRVGRFSPRIR